MLSTRQWCLVTCLFVVYLLFGTVVFYYIESNEEEKRFREHVLKSEEEIINHGRSNVASAHKIRKNNNKKTKI